MDFDKGVAGVIQHAAHDRGEEGFERGRQMLERFQVAEPRP